MTKRIKIAMAAIAATVVAVDLALMPAWMPAWTYANVILPPLHFAAQVFGDILSAL